jgi:hypothetical protein
MDTDMHLDKHIKKEIMDVRRKEDTNPQRQKKEK